ncbi:hypothetical protein HK102_007673, partial [Quaeritorhiza haematococci]
MQPHSSFTFPTTGAPSPGSVGISLLQSKGAVRALAAANARNLKKTSSVCSSSSTSSLPDSPDSSSPDSPTNSISSNGNTITIDVEEYERLQEAAKRLPEVEARLRARDQYLNEAIMDTARRIAELENQVLELQNLNEDMSRELKYAKEDKEALQQELADLDDDNLMLQNQLSSADIVAQTTPEPGAIEDEFVLLRDIQVQTEDVAIGGGSIDDVEVQDASTQTVDPTTPEQHILSLTSRLTMANLMAETLQETIKEMELQLGETRATNDALIQRNWELKVQVEHVNITAIQRNKIIEELVRRIERADAERTAHYLKRTVFSMMAAGRPSVLPSSSSPSLGMNSSELSVHDLLRELNEVPQQLIEAANNTHDLPAPPPYNSYNPNPYMADDFG